MYTFNELDLLHRLTALRPEKRTAFALAAATRQLPSLEYFKHLKGLEAETPPRVLISKLWSDLERHEEKHAEWNQHLQDVLGLLPDESEDWSLGNAFLDDALSTLAYALRSMLSGDPKEAPWAGRGAYEAADQAAIRLMRSRSGSVQTEVAIKAHQMVQRELERQNADLVLLATKNGTQAMTDVRDRALSAPLLTDREMQALSGAVFGSIQ